MRITLLTVLVALSAACTHHRNMQRSEALSGPDGEVFVSQTAYEDGTPRHVVVETARGVVDGCSETRIETFQYTEAGVLARQTSELRRCSVPTESVEEAYDFSDARWVRQVRRDTDRDGRFDMVAVEPGAVVEPSAVALELASR